MSVKGVGGNIPIVGKGTIRWWIITDSGDRHPITIHNAYYAPRLQLHLLCPQQWAQQGKRNYLGYSMRETRIAGNTTKLIWATGSKTVKHDPTNNLPIMYSAAGYESFESYAAQITIKTYEARMIPTHQELLEEVLRSSDDTYSPGTTRRSTSRRHIQRYQETMNESYRSQLRPYE